MVGNRLRASSFQVMGPTLFNSLPPHLRNITNCSVETFKSHLDQYLSGFPDQPVVVGGLLPHPMDMFTAVNSNSIKDWTSYLNIQNRHPVINQMW